ncbi:MAG: adenine phosphoribosyltransferase [Chlamydiae bacterium]|nr:adenine phosphoribosyltransferase [Chlamydiota bacterium]
MKKIILGLIAFISLLGAVSSQGEAKETGECYWIRDYITPVADFPQKGIMFQWYANLLKEPKAFHNAIQEFAKQYRGYNLDAIVGLDSRGFIFGAALAYELKVPFVLVRKPGKLPCKVEKIDYALEYGTNSFEIEIDSLKPRDRVLIIDDVLATGGTVRAASALVERLGAEVVEVACLIEISPLQGRKKIKAPVYSLLTVGGEESNPPAHVVEIRHSK